MLFSPDDERSVFFRCSQYNPRNWSTTSYYVVVLEGAKQNRSVVEIPKGDLVTPPVIAGLKIGDNITFKQHRNKHIICG